MHFDEDNNRSYMTASADHGDGQVAHEPPLPLWQRELAASRVNRSSRASSIISTRTRLTVQSEDARSVEIQAGDQTFRISRDGSNVSDVTAPPPYPGPPLEGVDEESDEEEFAPSSRPSAETVRDDDSPAEEAIDTQDLPIRTHEPPETASEASSPATQRKMGSMESFNRLKSMISMKWYGDSGDSQSPDSTTPASSLRRTQSESSSLANVRPFRHEADNDLSMPYVNGLSFLDAEQKMHEADLGIESDVDQARSRTASIASQHYQQLMRDLDRQHRKALHERDVELAKYRELLDNQDKVYRQQLRERDFTIENLRRQISLDQDHAEGLWKQYLELEESLEARLEKARNEVEDVWEKRWKEYELLLTRKLREGHGQHTLANVVQNGELQGQVNEHQDLSEQL